MILYLRYILLIFLLPWLFFSCGQSTKSLEVASDQFVVKNFNPTANWKQGETIFLDYSDAMEKGFIIPTIHQVEGGFFRMEFNLKIPERRHRNFSIKSIIRMNLISFLSVMRLTVPNSIRMPGKTSMGAGKRLQPLSPKRRSSRQIMNFMPWEINSASLAIRGMNNGIMPKTTMTAGNAIPV